MNFSDRLKKLFSRDLSDEEIESVYINAINELYKELAPKYGITEPRLKVIKSIEAVSIDELPIDHKEAIAGTYRNSDGTYDLVICPENTRTAFKEVNLGYNNDINNYIWCSAAHEVCHVITYKLGKWIKGHDHSFFWYDLYKDLKPRYSKFKVGWDYANNIGDFCIKSNKVKNVREFVGRYPDGYATRTHNTKNPICIPIISKEDYNKEVKMFNLNHPLL